MVDLFNIEVAILSSCMFQNEIFPQIKPYHFTHSEHRKIYQRLEVLAKEEEPLDEDFICKDKDIDREAVLAIMGEYPPADIKPYIELLIEQSSKSFLKRKMLKMINEIDEGDVSYKDLCNDLEKILSDNQNSSADIKSFAEWAEWADSHPPLPIYGTGVDFLDRSLDGGIELGQLVLISGEADAGKTALGIQIIKNVAKHYPVLFFAFEFTVRKFIKAQREIEGDAFMGENMFIEADDSSLSGVSQKIKKAAKQGIKFFLIDSQMRLKANTNRSMEEEETEKFFVLANLARKLEVTIILIVQTSKKDPNTPMGSKKANHEADIFIKIEHEKPEDSTKPYSTSKRKVSIIKNKQNGHIFSLTVNFNGFLRSFGENIIRTPKDKITIEYQTKSQEVETQTTLPFI